MQQASVRVACVAMVQLAACFCLLDTYPLLQVHPPAFQTCVLQTAWMIWLPAWRLSAAHPFDHLCSKCGLSYLSCSVPICLHPCVASASAESFGSRAMLWHCFCAPVCY